MGGGTKGSPQGSVVEDVALEGLGTAGSVDVVDAGVVVGAAGSVFGGDGAAAAAAAAANDDVDDVMAVVAVYQNFELRLALVACQTCSAC